MKNRRVERPQAFVTMERRLGAIVSAYDEQGNHRTGTLVDEASARWLAGEARKLGVNARCEPYSLSRIDPESCYLRVAGRRIEGLPLFDGGFTPAAGVSGVLGVSRGRAGITLASAGTTLASTASASSKNASLLELRSGNEKGIVLFTEGRRDGLSLLNATKFSKPFGPPVLQVSSSERQWLQARARSGLPATLVAKVKRTPARSFNVVGEISGADRNLRPLVVSTPRSGWWQCAGERGGGLACWLELMRVLGSRKPARDCLFVAFSGHELGFLGIRAFLKRRPGFLARAHTWIHFGANLGAPRQPFRIQCGDPVLEADVLESLAVEGADVNSRAGNDGPPRGEVSILKKGGVRYLAPICASESFHHSSDRWPEAVDLCALSMCASAFSRVAVKIANQAD